MNCYFCETQTHAPPPPTGTAACRCLHSQQCCSVCSLCIFYAALRNLSLAGLCPPYKWSTLYILTIFGCLSSPLQSNPFSDVCLRMNHSGFVLPGAGVRYFHWILSINCSFLSYLISNARIPCLPVLDSPCVPANYFPGKPFSSSSSLSSGLIFTFGFSTFIFLYAWVWFSPWFPWPLWFL